MSSPDLTVERRTPDPAPVRPGAGSAAARPGASAEHAAGPSLHALHWSLGVALAVAMTVIVLARPLLWSAHSAPLQGALQAVAGVEPRRGPGGGARALQAVRAYFREPGVAILDAPGFSYRERKHFQEVKRLLRVVEQVERCAWVSLLIVMGGACGLGRKEPLRIVAVSAGSMRLAAIFLGLTLLSVLGFALGFERGFVLLHRLAFEGRDWILPADSLTLALFPKAFFVAWTQFYGLLILFVAGASYALGRGLGSCARADAMGSRRGSATRSCTD